MPCEGCGIIEASLQCPTCKKLGLKPSFFHSQECFKKHWAEHKIKHTREEISAAMLSTMSKSDIKTFNFTGPLRPGKITPRRTIPAQINVPDYATRIDGKSLSEERLRGSNKIVTYDIKKLGEDDEKINTREKADILKIKKVCRLSREILDIACAAVRPGITTDEIDRIVHDATIERNMYPSPLNYYNFPKSVCTSVNEVICHGIPDNRPLEDGDILNIDVSSYLDGFHGDLNETVFVGKPDTNSVTLVHAAYSCLMAGINAVKPDELYRHIGDKIEECADKFGVSVVRTYTGHGIGKLFHTNPTICHYRNNKSPSIIKPGHVFTIEPMINFGTWQDITWPDKWTSTTRDGKRSAQFEHTMVCTNDGVEILTNWKNNTPYYQTQLKQWSIQLPTESFIQ